MANKATLLITIFTLLLLANGLNGIKTPRILNGTYDTLFSVNVAVEEEHTYWFEALPGSNPCRIHAWAEHTINDYPVMIVIEQEKQITSWQLPLLVNAKDKLYTFGNTSRTLCYSSLGHYNAFYRNQLRSSREENKRFSLTLSTFSPTPIAVQFKAVEFDRYNIEPDVNYTVETSPSQPVFYYYAFPQTDTIYESVFIDIDSTDDHCVVVSIQKSFCPVREMSDDITYEGEYLTMTRKGGLYTSRRSYPDGFFLVFVVRPDNYDCSAQNSLISLSTLAKSLRQQTRRSRLRFKVTKGIDDKDFVRAIMAVFGAYVGFSSLIGLLTFVVYKYKNWHRSDAVDTSIEIPRTDVKQLLGCKEDDVKLVALDTKPQNDRKASNYCYHISNIGLFYGIPVVQLMVTYQRAVQKSGNQDICYHNFACAHPVLGIDDFNHIYSNIGYIMMGILFILLVTAKKYTTVCAPHDGIPKYYGLFYAMGVGLMLEGLLSCCYHVCPNQMNFQFDTSFMYTMAILIIVKLYQSRHPDLNATAYAAFTILGIAVFLAMIGIITSSIVVLVLFIVSYFTLCLYVSFKIYFFGQVLQTLIDVYRSIADRDADVSILQILKPLRKRQFIILILANIINYTIAGVCIYYYPAIIDFGTYLLIILMSNAVLYMIFYIGMKFHYKERLCAEAIIYAILTLCTWLPSAYFFFDASTLWTVSPAESRQMNTECILLKFYDGHDVWHMLSALALFFSFMLLLTVDDNLNDKHKVDIHVF